MDNASLPYLSRIANAVEKLTGGGGANAQAAALAAIAKSISVSVNSESTINTEGNKNTAAIAEHLDKGLLTSVQDGSSTIIKSLLELLRTALVDELHADMTVTVQEQQGGQTVNVEKSVFEVMKDQIVKAIHDELTTTIEINNTPTEVNIAYLLSGIMTANQAIATALSGLGTALTSIQTNTANTAARLLDGNNTPAGSILAQIQGNTGSTYTDVHTITGDIHDTNGIKDDIEQMKNDIGTIKTDINSSGGIKGAVTGIQQTCDQYFYNQLEYIKGDLDAIWTKIPSSS